MRIVFTSLFLEACEFWIDRFGEDRESYGIDKDIFTGKFNVIQF